MNLLLSNKSFFIIPCLHISDGIGPVKKLSDTSMKLNLAQDPIFRVLRQRTRQLVLIERVVHQLLELTQFGRYLPSKVVFIQLQAHQVGREPQLLLIAFEMVFRSIKHLELLEVYETRRKFSCERVIVKLKLP
jgi:hypothetical protein